MRREFKARTFKSGNSVALRLPKALGVLEGDEVGLVEHADGRFSMWRVDDADKVLDSLFGSMSPGFMKHGRGDIEQAERVWDRDREKPAA